ncbi:MAG: hypothetical protein HKO91_08070 [Desulfobacterales bacterium]|nr:hypothetical protein [Desulfobacterales bacterium]
MVGIVDKIGVLSLFYQTVTQIVKKYNTAGKILSGREDQIIPCDECLKCFATIGRGVPMACKVNKNLPFAKQKRDV